MIVDNGDNAKSSNMSQMPPSGPPPSYENVVGGSGPYISAGSAKGESVKVAPQQNFQQPTPAPALQGQAGPTVYNYVNPVTGEHVASLLPPDHPQMVCLQEGRHITDSHFGLLGVLAAVFWFPAGVICCLLDRRVTCKRCGIVISHGLTPSFD